MENKLKSVSGSTLTGSIQWGSSWPELASPAERDLLLAYLEDRFGIDPDGFDGFLFFKKKKSWWIATRTPLLASVSRLKISRMGMKAFQKVGQFLKPTTRFIQVFGSSASRTTLVIDEAELSALQEGKGLSLDLDIDQGYVILMLDENRAVGLGLYVNGTLRSQVSRKALKIEMLGGEEGT